MAELAAACRRCGHETLSHFALALRLVVARCLRRIGKLEEAEYSFKILAGGAHPCSSLMYLNPGSSLLPGDPLQCSGQAQHLGCLCTACLPFGLLQVPVCRIASVRLLEPGYY